MTYSARFMKKVVVTSVLLAFLAISGVAYAIPTLQLDIAGGTYIGGGEESVMTTADSFTLYALGTAGTGSNGNSTTIAGLLADEFFISIALSPKTGPTASSLGSITLKQQGGILQTINVTSDMTYGTPPATGTGNPALGGHGVYETFYFEHAFNFNTTKRTSAYNVQDSPGAGFLAGTNMLYMGFDINVAGLAPGYELHFDLYSTKLKNGKIVRDDFAPFSHDAGTLPGPPVGAPVPEPSTIILLGTGILGLFAAHRFRK